MIAGAVEFYAPVADAAGVRLLHLARESEPVMLRGDPSLLFESVGNLIDNALKFTPRAGCVMVSGFIRNGRIGFEVEDTGPGISAEEACSVLRRFYRAESSRNTPGSGLGLALVAAVARLHGMDLAIDDAKPGCRITVARREAGFASGVPGPDGSPDRAGPWGAAEAATNAPA